MGESFLQINMANNESAGAASAVITGIVIIVLVFLFFMYGLPRMRDNNPTINVPDRIDVK